ncbi:hypothetical protein GCM10017750_67790 [Streptomyces racemochromogenes]
MSTLSAPAASESASPGEPGLHHGPRPAAGRQHGQQLPELPLPADQRLWGVVLRPAPLPPRHVSHDGTGGPPRPWNARRIRPPVRPGQYLNPVHRAQNRFGRLRRLRAAAVRVLS